MLPPPYPVLIYLMCASFFIGMIFYRTVHILVRRHYHRHHQ